MLLRARGSDSPDPWQLLRAAAGCWRSLLLVQITGEGVVLEEDPQDEEIIARVAALDIGKAELVCCARVPCEGAPGRRCQEVDTYSTMSLTP